MCNCISSLFVTGGGGRGGWSKCYNLQIVFCFFLQYCLVLCPLFSIRELDILYVNCLVRANSSFPNDINHQPLFVWSLFWSPVTFFFSYPNTRGQAHRIINYRYRNLRIIFLIDLESETIVCYGDIEKKGIKFISI